MKVIPVLQEADGIYKTFFDEIGRRYTIPSNPSNPGYRTRSFATLKHLMEAFPGFQFQIKSLVVKNTKVAKAVPEDKIERALQEYEKKVSTSTAELSEEVLDKLAEKILQKLEAKLVGG